MPKMLTVGIVGLGRLGRRHAENLATKVPGLSLVAAASPVASELEWAKERFGVACYPDLASLLGHPGLDVVWLVTPTSFHADQAIQVLEAGKHLFCEKPLSLDVEPCDRVIAAARARPRQTAMIGFMRRFDPAYAEVKRAVASGELGKVFRIHCESHDPVDPGAFFVKFAPTSGGIFLDCCIHDIDLARWVLGSPRPLKVSASGTRVMYPGLASCGDVDNAAATVEFEGGALATFFVSRTSHRGYEATMSVTGTDGALSCGRDIGELPLQVESGGSVARRGQADFFSRFGDAFLREANAFVAAVQSGGPSPISLEDAREATRLGVAMREALEKGGPILL
jgi:myo-inositol 2-dehydrogenase / D-chiro-inositol 1-dehydrogenase